MSKQKGHDYSTVLIWSAALVTVVRYAAAFVVSDSGQLDASFNGIMEFAMLLSGLGMGILDVIGGTYLFTGWQKKMPKSGDNWSLKFKVLTFFTIGLIVNGVLILIPFTVSRLSGMSMYGVLGNDSKSLWLIGWATVVNIAPYLLVGGVSVGNTIVGISANEQTNVRESVRPGESENTNKKYSGLNRSEKYFILNTKSEQVAKELGVTQRAVQKWRKKVQDEISQGKL